MLRNRLSSCLSPYLRQHADNPVHWQPWDRDAFSSARTLSRPIFLSIGYSTCHWCHVMAQDSFSSSALAEYLNSHFVCVKVDREERPDIDQHYMLFVQAFTGGHGGWPLTVWCTPDGRPLWGGTFMWAGQLKGLCEKIVGIWEERRDGTLEMAKKGHKLILDLAGGAHVEGTASIGHDVAIKRLFEHYQLSFDSQFGGFGAAPKFPSVPGLFFLLDYWREKHDRRALEMVTKTATSFIRSSLHDHVGSGFHRYCVDVDWKTPHFEKMLYDQGQLLELFSDLYTIHHVSEKERKLLKDGMQSIIRYIKANLCSQSGTFYCAEDADSLDPDTGQKQEGAFAVWTFNELKDIIPGDELPLLMDTFGVTARGNAAFKNTLSKMNAEDGLEEKYRDYEQRLDKIIGLLRVAREKRPKPHRDEKVLTAWNGLMISGLARAGWSLGNPDVIEMACKAFNAIVGGASLDGQTFSLSRTTNTMACADDYAFLSKAAIDLYQVTLDKKFLETAVTLQESLETLFSAPSGAYYYNPEDPEGILVRKTDDFDGAEPSANSVISWNLYRLQVIYGNGRYKERLWRMIEAFPGAIRSIPMTMPFMARTLLAINSKPLLISLNRLEDDVVGVLKAYSSRPFHLRHSKEKVVTVCHGNVCLEPCKTASQLDYCLQIVFGNEY